MDKLKVLSLFSGIGAFEKAFTNLHIDFELIGFSEIDKYAIKSYCAIHNVDESLNYGDVSKINKGDLPHFDLLVGGSPCQSFSVAGHRKGFEDTRGTLFFQYVETLKYKQPKYFVYENVKGLINHDKGNTLEVITQSFSEVGYRIDIELLNSKYFSAPQNRERIYIIGIREDLVENEEWVINSTRNDVLAKGKRRLKELGIKSFNFAYPKQENVNKRLRDILETSVDEKYYLSEDKTTKLVEQLENRDEPQVLRPERTDYGKTIRKQYESGKIQESRHNMTELHPRKDGISNTLSTVQKDNLLVEPQLQFIGGITDEPNWLDDDKVLSRNYKQGYRVYDSDGLSTSITSQGGEIGSYSGLYVVKSIGNVNPSGNGMNGEVYDSNGLSPTITTNKGEGLKIIEEVPHWIPKPDGINRTIRSGGKGSLTEKHNWDYIAEEVRPVVTPDREEKCQMGRRFKENDEPAFTVNTIDKHGVAIGNYPKYRIRKLTPLECFRLQAFSDEDYQKCVEIGISNSQLYKQSGNSITVTVLEEIFKELFNTYDI